VFEIGGPSGSDALQILQRRRKELVGGHDSTAEHAEASCSLRALRSLR
jgi:hypothetical protein